jgi:hypothetical protein
MKTALLIAWLAASTLALPVLWIPTLLPVRALVELAPVCTHTAAGGECFLCGAVAGFLLMAHGSVNASANRSLLGIPLYAALICNECVAVWYTIGELQRALTPRRSGAPARGEELSCRP